MTKEELESKLPQITDPEIRTKLMIAFNAAARSRKAYIEKPTARVRRDMDDAEEILSRLTAEVFPDPDAGRLPTIEAVLDYLVASGWKVSKTSLHRHRAQGKILPSKDGSYDADAVDRYARTFLKLAATGKKAAEDLDDLQRRKTAQELKNLELKYERDRFAYDREQGLYVPREQMDIDLAGRAGVLEAGLKHWVQAHAAEWIALAAGDSKRVGELINRMIRDVDDHINTYAAARDYEIEIPAAEADE